MWWDGGGCLHVRRWHWSWDLSGKTQLVIWVRAEVPLVRRKWKCKVSKLRGSLACLRNWSRWRRWGWESRQDSGHLGTANHTEELGFHIMYSGKFLKDCKQRWNIVSLIYALTPHSRLWLPSNLYFVEVLPTEGLVYFHAGVGLSFSSQEFSGCLDPYLAVPPFVLLTLEIITA